MLRNKAADFRDICIGNKFESYSAHAGKPQAILNIAVVTTTIPTTGIALPFFSYGGTALIMQLAEMGIILSISRFSSGEKNTFENRQRNYQPI